MTRNVGPFKVTGLEPAVNALQRIFALVRRDNPDLYPQLGTAGMLCIRAVRNVLPLRYSNHSWGTAIDLTIGGILVPLGSNYTLVGLVVLYPYFHAEKFYWGAGFGGSRPDPMHFEASLELLRDWKTAGLLGAR